MGEKIVIVIAAAAQHQQLITPARDRYRKTNTYLTPSTYSYSYLRKMKKSMRVSFLVALTAGLAVLSVVSAEDAPAAAVHGLGPDLPEQRDGRRRLVHPGDPGHHAVVEHERAHDRGRVRHRTVRRERHERP